MKDLLTPFTRHRDNPILQREEIPYPANTVFNAGACRFGEEYLLILRVEDMQGRSHLTQARSTNGYDFTIDDRPWVIPSRDEEYEPYEKLGVEDPRVTPMEDAYYLTYTAYGPYGPRVAIGRTEDFETFERIGLATEPDNKDALLFPEKIDGRYVMIDRPSGYGTHHGSIWMHYSPDLRHWGDAHILLTPEPGWGASKLGGSTPPIATDEGWLVLYHGVRETGSGRLYRVGAMLLDRDQPRTVRGYTRHFIFGPEADYERTGDVPNVVFPCGIVPEENGTLKMYYGAADTCIGMAEAALQDLVDLCLMDEEKMFFSYQEASR